MMIAAAVIFAIAPVVSAAAAWQGQQDYVSRVLLQLDRNGDQRVDKAEISAFAASQGLDASQATEEIASFDYNGDGVLSADELAGSMRLPQVQAQALPQVQQVPSANLLESSRRSSKKTDAVSSAANTVVEQLALEQEAEEQAEAFSRRASELRANSTALERVSSQRALRAGTSAASKKAQELLEQLSGLEDQAAQAEEQAAFLRQKSKSELQQADEFSSIAASSMTVGRHV
mmetsp:Transcript_104317/g.185480  ORF Transcript_104317/g.185480 Transcript_104317/m.185480 type:complete len:232 (+) Transcript_104317:90-785(+)